MGLNGKIAVVTGGSRGIGRLKTLARGDREKAKKHLEKTVAARRVG